MTTAETPARRWMLPALVLLVLALAWGAYHPGLSGGFLFDDYVNLDALGNMGRVHDWPSFARYLTSGTADPLGRPLSLLSFLLDGNDWPTAPGPFLRTNVLLHLLNGALLFWLLRGLGRRLDGPSTTTDLAALLGAGMWLLHPLLVSTTLYIVQREAMLPATFTLLGLLGWLHGRGLQATRPRRALAWMVFSIGAGTALAMLSKANGVLLPLLAWVIDATIPERGPRGIARTPAAVRRVLLIAPSVLLFGYLASKLSLLGQPLDFRPWTLEQRLLTEPRVLVDYVMLLAVPRVLSTGLYNDAYPVSTGLLSPWTTLPALLLVVGVAVAAVSKRRRWPAASAAVLFFLAGHALESSTIPLELYFEHRNYLPAMLAFWPLARGIAALRMPPPARKAIGAGLLAMVAALTWQRAGVWGDPPRLAALWALQNPGSSRAQATAASFEVAAGKAAAAHARLAPLRASRPHDLQVVLNDANAACALGGLAPRDVADIAIALRNAREGDQLVHRWLGNALTAAMSGGCAGLDRAAIRQWLDAASSNPALMALPGRRQDLLSLHARLALADGKPALAERDFDLALAAEPTPQVALMQAALLASAGQLEAALRHLDRYQAAAAKPPHGWTMQRVHALVLARQGYWAHEIAALRSTLRSDLADRRSRMSR